METKPWLCPHCGGIIGQINFDPKAFTVTAAAAQLSVNILAIPITNAAGAQPVTWSPLKTT